MGDGFQNALVNPQFTGLVKIAGAVQITATSPLPGGASNILQISDLNGIPISSLAPAGGWVTTDNVKTTANLISSVPGGTFADIYGDIFYGYINNNTFVGNILHTGGLGPPGNLLPYADACLEIFQGSRAGSLGTWAATTRAALASVDATAWGAGAGTPSFDGLHAGQATITAGGATTGVCQTASGLAGVPLTLSGRTIATTPFTGLVFGRTPSASRTATLGIIWYDNTGTLLSRTVSGAVTLNNGGWTPIQVGVAANGAPATAAFAALELSYGAGAAAAGETCDFVAAALFPWTAAQTNQQWSKPVVANILGTGASQGDIYERAGTVGVANQNTYKDQTAGVPNQQVWVGIN